jgi:hypothetical protein
VNACRARICSSTSSDRVPSAARPKDRRRDRGSQVSLVQDRGQPGSSLFRVRLLSYLPILCIRVHTCLHVVGHERADKSSTGAGPRRRPRRRASQARTPISVDTRRDAEVGSPKTVRDDLAAIGDRVPAARRVARRPEGRAATADAALAEKRWVRRPSRSEMAVGPPLLGRDGEERPGSGSEQIAFDSACIVC